MQNPSFAVTDRTDAADVIAFLRAKMAAYDMRLLDWVRLSPMTDAQHAPEPGGDIPPVTISTCWTPREDNPTANPPQPEHMYRIKVNVWQGSDYPLEEAHWGRIPPRPIRRRNIPDRYTTRGLCKWRYPDRLAATVHALARPLFLYLANTRQVALNPSESNASAWGHRWAAEWLRRHDQEHDAEAMVAQLMQWTLIQSKGL
ncbi:MAG: hypothetical protein OEU91_01335 [Gammaproteobacteria bacterium]|nr:hypothetical protein [Gammaproteobacteria bacterium]